MVEMTRYRRILDQFGGKQTSMSELQQLECLGCGASIKISAQTSVFKCDYCGCEFKKAPQKQLSSEWIKHLSLTEGEKSDIARSLFRINELADSADFEEIYRLAKRMVEIAPQRWEGFYHAARAAFWFNATNTNDFNAFFALLTEAFGLLDKCYKVIDDVSIAVALDHEFVENLAQIAKRGEATEFTGTNVKNSFKIFLLCRKRLPENPILRACMEDYGHRLVNWSAAKLSKEKEAMAAKEFIPSEVYLEYLYYAWKHFGITDGLPMYDVYAGFYLKNSGDEEYKNNIRAVFAELEANGLSRQDKQKKKGIMSKFFG
jgi:predicted RNA-binding Zn-ribbon protein involved in translation (DUF1610 family)